jgi:hypothetical protein
MADLPGTQTVPYNEDYSLMIYQNDTLTNDTYITSSQPYAIVGENNGATDTYTGEFNTQSILNTTLASNTVAKQCNDFSVTVDSILYNDWYLPSTEEMTAIYNAGYIIGVGTYWTSTEYDTDNAYKIDIATGVISTLIKSSTNNAVPVRKVYLNDYVTIERMNVQSKNAAILRGGENNADEDVYKMLGGVNGISKNSNILSNE